MQTDIAKIITAMKIMGLNQMSEGAVYWALFKLNLNPDEATNIISNAEKSGKIIRKGCLIELSDNGKEDLIGERPVCNS